MQRLFIILLIWIVSTLAKLPPEMLSFMDESVEPCNDFYQYACGGWLKTNRKQPSYTWIESSGTLHAKNEQVFNEIIKENHPIVSELWSSCMALEKNTKDGNEPLQKDLRRFVKAQTTNELMELLGEFSRTGANSIMKLIVAPDSKDGTRNTVYVRPGDFTLPSAESYSNTNLLSAAEEYMTDLMKLSGFSLKKRRTKRKNEDREEDRKRDLKEDGEETGNWKEGRKRNREEDSEDDGEEDRKRDRKEGRKEDGDEEYHVADTVTFIETQLALTSKQLQGQVVHIPIAQARHDWSNSIGPFLTGTKIYEKSGLPDDFEIVVEYIDYFNAVDKFIQNLPLDQFKVFVAYSMVHSRVEWLGEKFDKVRFTLQQHITGQQRQILRDRLCRSKLVTFLPDLFGGYYYSKVFDKKRKRHVERMVQLIRKVMGEHISHSTWLNKDDQEAAITKLNKVVSLVGKPDVPRSHPSKLSSVDYPANVYTILSHAYDAELRKVGQRVNRNEWTKSPAHVGACYSPNRNTITFPAAMLQPPHFNGSKLHPARNFGALGFFIGHELTHGFDTIGCMYDGDGTRSPWWSEETSKVYKDRAKCFADQYSEFQVIGEHRVIGKVNGNFTLNENIADNGGLALAWDAYRKYMSRRRSKTNGIHPEGDLLFFLAFAQSMCSCIRDPTMEYLLALDHHAPSQWRVNGVVMNHQEFKKVFECKEDAPMNPSKKCHVW